MTKKYKFLAILLLALVTFYITAWFIATKEIKSYFSEIEKKNLFKFEKVSVTGFPFRIKIRIDQLEYKNDSIENAKVELATESLKLTTNVFFNKISFYFPKIVKIKTILDQKEKNFKLEAGGNHKMVIKQRNLFNTIKVISSLYNKVDNLFKEFDLYEVDHTSDEVSLYDLEDNSKIIKSSNNLRALFFDQGDTTSMDLKFNNNINILNHAKFNINFDFFNSSFDSTIKYKKDNFLSAEEISVKKSNFQIDDFKLEIIGFVKKEKSKFDLEINVKLNELRAFLEKLQKQEFISLQQSVAIEQLIQNMTGINCANKCEFKLYTSKDDEIRFGRLDFNSIINHIQLIMMSK